jgi:hypothetical protein
MRPPSRILLDNAQGNIQAGEFRRRSPASSRDHASDSVAAHPYRPRQPHFAIVLDGEAREFASSRANPDRCRGAIARTRTRKPFYAERLNPDPEVVQ